jgi:hypothetical protein
LYDFEFEVGEVKMKFDKDKKYAVHIKDHEDMMNILEIIQRTSNITWIDGGEKPTEYVPVYKRNSLGYWPKENGLYCNVNPNSATWLNSDEFIRMCSQFYPRVKNKTTKGETKMLYSFNCIGSQVTLLIDNRIRSITKGDERIIIKYTDGQAEYYPFLDEKERGDVYLDIINAWNSVISSFSMDD